MKSRALPLEAAVRYASRAICSAPTTAATITRVRKTILSASVTVGRDAFRLFAQDLDGFREADELAVFFAPHLVAERDFRRLGVAPEHTHARVDAVARGCVAEVRDAPLLDNAHLGPGCGRGWHHV